MNNRFKFRVWNKLSNEMKDVISLNINYDFPDCSNVVLETNTFDAIKTHNNPINCSVGLKNVVIMQCTGLKDKNGKLIYEGDIVKVACMHEKMGGFYYLSMQVIYEVNEHGNDAYSGFALKLNEKGFFALWGNNKTEVIGNIYENPELLQECE